MLLPTYGGKVSTPGTPRGNSVSFSFLVTHGADRPESHSPATGRSGGCALWLPLHRWSWVGSPCRTGTETAETSVRETGVGAELPRRMRPYDLLPCESSTSFGNIGVSDRTRAPCDVTIFVGLCPHLNGPSTSDGRPQDNGVGSGVCVTLVESRGRDRGPRLGVSVGEDWGPSGGRGGQTCPWGTGHGPRPETWTKHGGRPGTGKRHGTYPVCPTRHGPRPGAGETHGTHPVYPARHGPRPGVVDV